MGPDQPPKPPPEESEAMSLFTAFPGELENGRESGLGAKSNAPHRGRVRPTGDTRTRA